MNKLFTYKLINEFNILLGSTCVDKTCGASCTTWDGTKGMCNDQLICEEQIVPCTEPVEGDTCSFQLPMHIH